MSFIKNKKNIFVIGIIIVTVALIIVLISQGLLSGSGLGKNGKDSYVQEVSKSEPLDVVGDFYNSWLLASNSTSSNPYKENLAKAGILSKNLKEILPKTEGQSGIDPVLCQNPKPTKLNYKNVFVENDKAQIVVFSKNQNTAGQAIVTLQKQNDGWFIENIVCSKGEYEDPKEFSFEREGNILMGVKPLLDPKYWYIVYTQDGTPGYTAPLLFNDSSTCVTANGTENVCDTKSFIQAKKISIQGNLNETGVEVKKLKFLD